jgi:alkylation response protein AidB-like acyl-CoA dehydrogenase
MIAGPGGALPACEYAIAHGIVSMCSEAVGIMDSILWTTRDFLKGRDQSGAPLHTFQALQHRMADMLVEVELSRSALHYGLYCLAQHDLSLRRRGVSACKIQVTRSAKFVAASGIQLHGALGLTDDHRIGQYFKRLTVTGMLLGGMDHHLAQFCDSRA